MAILKSDVQMPVLPKERLHDVPELGGEVIVRPLMLSDRLALAQHPAFQTNGRPTEFKHIAALLEFAVVDANHEPLFSAEQWDAWGSQHIQAALALWDVAWQLSGLDTERSKKKSGGATSEARDAAGAEDGAHAGGTG